MAALRLRIGRDVICTPPIGLKLPPILAACLHYAVYRQYPPPLPGENVNSSTHDKKDGWHLFSPWDQTTLLKNYSQPMLHDQVHDYKQSYMPCCLWLIFSLQNQILNVSVLSGDCRASVTKSTCHSECQRWFTAWPQNWHPHQGCICHKGRIVNI